MALPGDKTASTLGFLQGSISGRRYEADELRGTDPADGRTLLARYDLHAARGRLTREALARRRGGLWRGGEVLPVRSRSFLTTPRVGGAAPPGPPPLAPAPRLARL